MHLITIDKALNMGTLLTPSTLKSLKGVLIYTPFCALLLLGCQLKPNPDSKDHLNLAGLKPYFTDSLPSPKRNPLSSEGIALGKALFFDPILSKDQAISCAMCHQAPLAFSDGVALGTNGHSGKALHRNSPPLFNLAWAKGYFWDGGATDLESQAFGPLQHPDEMAVDLNKMIDLLRKDDVYPNKFKRVFGTDAIETSHVVRALAQYQRSLISDSSPFDQYKQGKRKLTPLALKGEKIYIKHCSSCHKAPFFTDFDYHSNGLDSVFSDEHEQLAWGRARISQDSLDLGKYKTPSLRNLKYTGPYMHDGRFQSLEEVLNHYTNGIKKTKTLDALLSKGISLNQQERKALLAFLESLNDERFIQKHSKNFE